MSVIVSVSLSVSVSVSVSVRVSMREEGCAKKFTTEMAISPRIFFLGTAKARYPVSGPATGLHHPPITSHKPTKFARLLFAGSYPRKIFADSYPRKISYPRKNPSEPGICNTCGGS